MAVYTKKTEKTANGEEIIRYKNGKNYVEGKNVPDNVRVALNNVREGVAVDELGDEVEMYKGKPLATGDVTDEKAPKTADEDADLGDDDDSEEDDEKQKPAEKPAPKPRARKAKTADEDENSEEGMGFPRVDGKTVDIFDGKTPHTHIRNVAGFMVPLSALNQYGDPSKNIPAKSDVEIMEKLKELGKIS